MGDIETTCLVANKSMQLMFSLFLLTRNMTSFLWHVTGTILFKRLNYNNYYQELRIVQTVIVLERGMAVKVNRQYMNGALSTSQKEVNCLTTCSRIT